MFYPQDPQHKLRVTPFAGRFRLKGDHHSRVRMVKFTLVELLVVIAFLNRAEFYFQYKREPAPDSSEMAWNNN